MIKIEEYKYPQHNSCSERFLNPKKLYLPLSQHVGSPAQECVEKGEIVEEGQLIASGAAHISASLHAPKKGKIIDVAISLHPILRQAKSIIIECGEEAKDYPLRGGIEKLEKQPLIDMIRNSGIIGMGGAAFPTHVKLTPPAKIDYLIVNGCECEPYLSTDYRLMKENMKEIFRGLEIICKIISPRQLIFAIEENKRSLVKEINFLINAKKTGFSNFRLEILKTAYPQGGEKQLIYAAAKRKIAGGKLPFDVGCLVFNVATVFAVYQTVYLNKPLIERLVTFAGDALVSPKNVWLKIGTTLRELFEEKILAFKHDPKKIICGGPMMGVALDNLNYPILKGTGGFLFLKEPVDKLEEQTCIRCARCVDVCPMNLLPLEYPKRVKKEEYNSLNDFNINDCIECGCCAYECPAKIPLVHYIKIGKKYLPR